MSRFDQDLNRLAELVKASGDEELQKAFCNFLQSLTPVLKRTGELHNLLVKTDFLKILTLLKRQSSMGDVTFEQA